LNIIKEVGKDVNSEIVQEGTGYDYFEIIDERVRGFGKFPVKGREISIRAKAGSSRLTPSAYVEKLFEFALDNLLSNADPQAWVGFSIESSNDVNGKDVFIPWRRRIHLTTDHILRSIENVLNSNESFLLADSVIIKANISDPIRGQGERKKRNNDKYLPLEEYLQAHIIPVPKLGANSYDCLPRALIMAEKKALSEYNKVRYMKEHPKNWEKEAKDLCKRANINISSLGGSIDDIDQFQDYYGNRFQIVVYALKAASRDPKIIYSGNVQTRKKIFLFYHDQHFDVIETITAFVRSKGYCRDCLKPYERRSKHKCEYLCEHCEEYHNFETSDEKRSIICNTCLRTFPSQSCYNNHNTKETLYVTM